MNLNLDYQPLFVFLSWFAGIAVIVGLGIVFLRNSFDDILDKIKTVIQTVKSIFDAFQN